MHDDDHQVQQGRRRRSIRSGEVSVRLTGRYEFTIWDELMCTHHDLGFRRFVGRGLRYIVERDGQWLYLAGWQTGCFKSAATSDISMSRFASSPFGKSSLFKSLLSL